MRPSLQPGADEGLENGPERLDLTHLSIGELFVIWAFRTRLAHGPNGPVAGFRLAFGLSGVERALASFEGLFGVLQHHCRSGIWLHGPGCPCVSRRPIPNPLESIGINPKAFTRQGVVQTDGEMRGH